jgi:plastocyanin
VLTKPPPGQLASIVLDTPAVTTVKAGASVTFTGTCYDSDGKGVPQTPIYPISNGVLVQSTPASTSGPSGSFSFALTFDTDGTYEIKVRPIPQGG